MKHVEFFEWIVSFDEQHKPYKTTYYQGFTQKQKINSKIKFSVNYRNHWIV